MRLSFSTNAFTRYSLFEAVKTIASIGYDGIELLADTPHLFVPSFSDSHLKELYRVVEQSGLRIANVNANTAIGYYGRTFWEPLFEPSLANPDPAARQWRIDYTRKCIDAAQALGAPSISVTSGRMVPGVFYEESMDLLRDSLRQVLSHASGSGVKVGIEYEPGLLIERFEELQALLKQLDSELLGANLDLGHSHVLGEDPDTVLEGLSSRVFHIHLEDILDRKHHHLVPGEGNMDISGLIGTLARHGYEGFITLELYTYPHEPAEAARRSLAYMRGLVSL